LRRLRAQMEGDAGKGAGRIPEVLSEKCPTDGLGPAALAGPQARSCSALAVTRVRRHAEGRMKQAEMGSSIGFAAVNDTRWDVLRGASDEPVATFTDKPPPWLMQ